MEKPIELWCSKCGYKGYFNKTFDSAKEREHELQMLKTIQHNNPNTFPCPNPDCHQEMELY